MCRVDRGYDGKNKPINNEEGWDLDPRRFRCPLHRMRQETEPQPAAPRRALPEQAR